MQLLFLGICCFLLQDLPHLLNLAPLLPLWWSTLLAPMWSKFYFSWQPTKSAFGSTFSTSSSSTVFVTSASSPVHQLLNFHLLRQQQPLPPHKSATCPSSIKFCIWEHQLHQEAALSSLVVQLEMLQLMFQAWSI